MLRKKLTATVMMIMPIAWARPWAVVSWMVPVSAAMAMSPKTAATMTPVRTWSRRPVAASGWWWTAGTPPLPASVEEKTKLRRPKNIATAAAAKPQCQPQISPR